MNKAQIMIRPDETGVKLVIHARNPGSQGFTFIESIGSPVTNKECADYEIRDVHRVTISKHKDIVFSF